MYARGPWSSSMRVSPNPPFFSFTSVRSVLEIEAMSGNSNEAGTCM